MDHAAGAQLFAHDACQGAAGGFGKIGNPETGGIQLVSGTHCADDGNCKGDGRLNQAQLAGDQVDGVHNVIILPALKKAVFARFAVQFRQGSDPAGGVDIQDALGHDVGLGAAQRGVEGDQLTVQIGFADRVVVHKRQCADAGAGQRLGAVAADAADAEYSHMTGAQSVRRIGSQQHSLPKKGLIQENSPFRLRLRRRMLTCS